MGAQPYISLVTDLTTAALQLAILLLLLLVLLAGTYWPTIKTASRCRGDGKWWAYKTCWKFNATATADWARVCR
jgi:hypothetical protein